MLQTMLRVIWLATRTVMGTICRVIWRMIWTVFWVIAVLLERIKFYAFSVLSTNPTSPIGEPGFPDQIIYRSTPYRRPNGDDNHAVNARPGFPVVYHHTDNPSLIVKVFVAADFNEARAEAKTIHDVRAGLKEWGRVPGGGALGDEYAIIMERARGAPLKSSLPYRQTEGNAMARQNLEQQYHRMVAEKVLYICRTYGVHHTDFHEDNVFVEFKDGMITAVHLIDWGKVDRHPPCSPDSLGELIETSEDYFTGKKRR